MLEVTTKTSVDAYQLHGTKMLNVTTNNSPHYFQAIMSAAQVSSSLSMIDIEIVDEDEADDWDSEDEEEVEHNLFAMIYWKWIAYTLFSRHANHSIKTLMLDMKSLRQPHVSQMREIIAAANPLASLNYVAKRDCLERQLTATRFLLTDPGNMARKTQAVYVAPQPMTVRVIYSPEDDEYPYWTVLVPGHGNAWVHKDKATDVTELATPTDDWRNAVPSFERIDISASHEDCMDAAVSLLELIGHGTKEIIVQNHEDDGSLDDWTRRVLKACPNLKSLTFGLAMVDKMKVFVDCAEAGKSRLQKISMSSTFSDEGIHFLRALVDPTHPLTVYLRELKTSFQIEKKNEFDAIVRAVQDALDNNRHLYKVNIGFQLVGEVESLSDDLQKAFATYNKEEVAIRVAPLELRSKVAFLSAVHAGKSRALSQLDSSLLQLVFQFAAQSRKRRVCIEPIKSRTEELPEAWGFEVSAPLAALLWG